MADDFRQFSRGDVISSRFEIEKPLDEGVLGATYLVRHIKSGKHLALKFIDPRYVTPDKGLNRFKAAIKSVREARHDGLVRYGDVGQHKGFIYFSQEYFQGGNLRDLLEEYQEEQKSFTLQEACQIVLKVLDTLSHLHAQNIIHSHLKPENVLIRSKTTGPGGRNVLREVKITDAGMATMLAATGADNDSFYRAPELGLGIGTPPSDVYSVGVMLYELLVGQTPRGTYLSPTQLRGDLPEAIDDIVEIALAANAEDRYQNPRDMGEHIKQTFSGDVFNDSRGSSFKNILIGVGVGIALISAVGVYINVRETPDPTADARATDEALRREAQAGNRLLSEEEKAVMEKDHQEMLYIPAGPVIKGRLNQEDLSIASQSEPLARVVQVEAFYIDRFEFPNRVGDGEEKVLPVAKANWQSASEACQTLGKRLCSEDEWEKACKGPGNWVYSYGDTYDAEMCGGGVDADYHIGERDTCVSGYGAWGMSGGPREWTVSENSSGSRRRVKGGLRSNNERGSRCAFATDESPTYADSTLSFRCCLSVGAAGQ
ncbi:MAG: bifunctional serine/threonine-protein kinase/formylglycine-generating enzyme family protein [Myxococcota bacterium]|nr:bifunctional serine/threonine-protein kinase/formylglycine-generating enzyme family protein [Myxococcota bacterium]